MLPKLSAMFSILSGLMLLMVGVNASDAQGATGNGHAKAVMSQCSPKLPVLKVAEWLWEPPEEGRMPLFPTVLHSVIWVPMNQFLHLELHKIPYENSFQLLPLILLPSPGQGSDTVQAVILTPSIMCFFLA